MDRQLKAMYHINYIFERFYDLEATKQKAFTTGFEEGGIAKEAGQVTTLSRPFTCPSSSSSHAPPSPFRSAFW